MVTLGAAVWPGSQPSPTLRRRVAKTVMLWRQGTADKIIVTGGVGPHPPSEAQVMRDLLIAAGVAPDAILMEPLARSTLENAALSVALMRAQGLHRAVVVTDGFHLARAGLAFLRFGHIVRLRSTHGAAPRPQLGRVLKRWVLETLWLPRFILQLALYRRRD